MTIIEYKNLAMFDNTGNLTTAIFLFLYELLKKTVDTFKWKYLGKQESREWLVGLVEHVSKMIHRETYEPICQKIISLNW